MTLKTANSLLEEKIKTHEFHLLSKTHKANNHGRPVIGFVNCHTSRFSEFGDYYLQPELRNLSPILKRLRILLRRLEP